MGGGNACGFGCLPKTSLGHQYHLMNHLGCLQIRADGSLMAPHWTGSPPLILHHTAFMDPKWVVVDDSQFFQWPFYTLYLSHYLLCSSLSSAWTLQSFIPLIVTIPRTNLSVTQEKHGTQESMKTQDEHVLIYITRRRSTETMTALPNEQFIQNAINWPQEVKTAFT